MADADPLDSGSRPRGRRHAFRTLRHRDFRLLWVGLLVSTTGQQIQFIAVAWHITVLTDSPLQVGLVGVFGAIPFIGLSFVGGAVADRIDRKRILMVTQTVAMLLTTILVVTTATGVIEPWMIYAVRFASGAATAFDNPARQAIIPNIVPRDELVNAFTLTSLLRQTANIAGPSVGGLLIGLFGLSVAYTVNAVTFLAVIVAVLLMGPVPMVRSRAEQGWDAMMGGVRYVRRHPLVLSLISLDAMVVGIGSYRALLPFFALDILDVGAQGLGLLQSAPGVGAVIGAMLMGTMGGVRRPIVAVLVSSAGFGLCVIGLGLSPFFPLTLLMLFGAGITDVVGEVQRATIVQLVTTDEVRGRVTALHQMFSFGGPQMGQLSAGGIATLVGPAMAAIIGGSAVVAIVARYSTFPAMRRGMSEATITSAAASSSGH